MELFALLIATCWKLARKIHLQYMHWMDPNMYWNHRHRGRLRLSTSLEPA
jgi:hypothetical protein